VIASGVSQSARRDVGTLVLGGMIFASFIGIFVTPPLCVFFQAILRKNHRLHRLAAKQP